MTRTKELKSGRKAFRQQAWADAYAALSSADNKTALAPEDLQNLAKAAFLIGKEPESIDIWTRAHHEYLERDAIPHAVYCAFWIGMILFNLGEGAQGSGWMARARRLIDSYQNVCAEEGFLLVPEALQHMRSGDHETAHQLFSRAVELGEDFQNKDLMTLGQLGRGQALINQNKIEEGTTLLDEAMVAILADEISPIVAGIVYCAVIETCQKIYDLRRAQEWTSALTRWCDSHPELVPYRGQCLVRRAEIMQLHGEWSAAITEVKRACELLSAPPGEPAAGEAFYRLAELYRLQGNSNKALEMYRQASKFGRKPQPGLALLRLEQGKPDVAKAAIQQLEKEKQDPIGRSRLLPAFVDIMLETSEISAARVAADELSKIASQFKAPYLQAKADHAGGSILLANGEARSSIEKLRRAWELFQSIEATYESARTRLLIARACRELGDTDTMQMELEAARWIFHRLGAIPDIEKVDSYLDKDSLDPAHGLTSREQQVLKLLATGKTNKEIGAELFISERTVDRHVSNILGKLNVPSRAAATAYAYEHNLI
ncbi:LuxR C-terminal-related transcriptional regulator [Aliifodinibius sp. S!AR15-10]|uniref:LuxR C-terminal-related transcriptional regulator n=1 Tax=Aliifodinibius sp. S!AR15-10 TaxID=2950437 RepID=UPI0028708970|nr:LuxR C-terminal-related transcriptional regulator [Aliifodinibius sp. S!AR15-10]